MKLEDCTDGKLQEIIEYSRHINMEDSLNKCIKGLIEYIDIDTDVLLFPDFAPYSLYFQVKRNDKITLDGGVIFHGKHDKGGDGQSPTFSVNLEPTDGWKIHT